MSQRDQDPDPSLPQDQGAEGHPEAVHLPSPTIWPVVCGAGVSLLGFGVVTSVIFTLLGVLVIAWAVAGWIRELLDE